MEISAVHLVRGGDPQPRFFFVAYDAARRSGHPGALFGLYIFLALTVSVGTIALPPIAGYDLLIDLMHTWYNGAWEPVPAAGLIAGLVTVIAVGNLVSLMIISLLGSWLAWRRNV